MGMVTAAVECKKKKLLTNVSHNKMRILSCKNQKSPLRFGLLNFLRYPSSQDKRPTRLSHRLENEGEKLSLPFCSSVTSPHAIIKKDEAGLFTGAISTALYPHKDLSKRSETAGQSNAADLCRRVR